MELQSLGRVLAMVIAALIVVTLMTVGVMVIADTVQHHAEAAAIVISARGHH